MTHTKDLLAEALMKANLPELAKEASEGMYHDFLSELVFPTSVLIEKLANVGTPEALALMTRVKEGEFDDSDDECDEWAETPEEINPITELSKHLTGEE